MLLNFNKISSNLFINLGLTQKESEAFLELIRLGASPISRWAKHAGINRSSMYVLLERLKSHSLLSTFIRHGVIHVQAVPMTELPAILSDKQAELEQTRNKFIAALPHLQKLEKTHGLTPKIFFYEGAKRVESMYEHVMKEQSFRAFFHPGRLKALMPEYFHKIPQALREHNGAAKELVIRGKEAEEYRRLYRSERHEIAFLPQTVKFSSDTIITDQKIYLVGYSDHDCVATEIWNEELAQTQSAIFDLVWASLSK